MRPPARPRNQRAAISETTTPAIVNPCNLPPRRAAACSLPLIGLHYFVLQSTLP